MIQSKLRLKLQKGDKVNYFSEKWAWVYVTALVCLLALWCRNLYVIIHMVTPEVGLRMVGVIIPLIAAVLLVKKNEST